MFAPAVGRYVFHPTVEHPVVTSLSNLGVRHGEAVDVVEVVPADVSGGGGDHEDCAVVEVLVAVVDEDDRTRVVQVARRLAVDVSVFALLFTPEA